MSKTDGNNRVERKLKSRHQRWNAHLKTVLSYSQNQVWTRAASREKILFSIGVGIIHTSKVRRKTERNVTRICLPLSRIDHGIGGVFAAVYADV